MPAEEKAYMECLIKKALNTNEIGGNYDENVMPSTSKGITKKKTTKERTNQKITTKKRSKQKNIINKNTTKKNRNQ